MYILLKLHSYNSYLNPRILNLKLEATNVLSPCMYCITCICTSYHDEKCRVIVDQLCIVQTLQDKIM